MQPSNEEIIRTVADDLPFGVWVARAPGGEFVYANKRFAEILGQAGRDDVAVGEYAQPYGIHTRTGELYPEDRMPFVQALRERKTVVVDDIVIHRHDGRKVYIRAQGKPIFRGDAITHVVIAFIDITPEVLAEKARLESETRLHQAQRLESIGKLAGGIAHDFNNLLATIKLIAETLQRQETDPKKRADLVCIDEVTEHAVRLTSALLGFAGRGKNLATKISINTVLTSMREIIHRTLERRIEVTFDLRATGAVVADVSQLEQVVMNLVVNARDAIPRSGEIVIRTGDVVLDESARARFPRVAPGEHVFIEVSDTGTGIAPEIRDRIFEPYFTTKTSGDRKGTGLGLATVYGIVDAHRGGIEFVNNVPAGTTFRVVLPSVPAPAPARPVAPRPSRVARSGNGNKILVVEDEPHVRNSCARALETLGYEPIPVADGAEAVSVYKPLHRDIAAVILDMVMPGMSGRETYLALREVNPGVRVLLTTGFALNEEAQGILDLGVKEFMAKPYDIASLGDALERVIPVEG